MSSGTEGLVEAFPSPDERWQQSVDGVSPWEESFDRVPFEEIGGTKRVRYYQELAASRALSPEKVSAFCLPWRPERAKPSSHSCEGGNQNLE